MPLDDLLGHLKQRAITRRRLSGSSCSPSSVEPVTSQKRTVTVLRSSAWLRPRRAEPAGVAEPRLVPVLGPAARADSHGTSLGRSFSNLYELEQLGDRRPVARRCRHAEAAASERGPQLRPGDPCGVPRVDLASVDDELLRLDAGLLEIALARRGQRTVEEAHLVALRVLRDVAERVARHDPGELGAGPRYHRDFEPEPFLNQAPDLPRRLLRLRLAGKHDVAALQVRLHVLEPGVFERGAQLGHRHAVAQAEVYTPQEQGLARHPDEPACRSASCFRRSSASANDLSSVFWSGLLRTRASVPKNASSVRTNVPPSRRSSHHSWYASIVSVRPCQEM